MVAADLALLDSIQRRVLWLATWMIHHANVLRPNPDGTKVGGHQASSASLTSVLTARSTSIRRTDSPSAAAARETVA
jgi:pyruvate dehydrogenase E1 component